MVELWRRFEVSEKGVKGISDSRDDASRMTHLTGDSARAEEVQAPASATPTTGASREQPQSLLAAFEAELAHVLSSTETEASENRTEQPRPSHDSGSPVGIPNLQSARPVVRDFVEKILHYINCQASGISTELEARMPGLRRQLSEAQRDLPESLREYLQGLFACLEQSVTSYGAVPSGRQLAEEVVQAGGPIAETAVESLQALASEFGHVGRTLFSAFENEFGRNGANATSSPSSASAGMSGVAYPNHISPSPDSQVTESGQTSCHTPKGKLTRSCTDSGSRSEVRTLFIGNVGYNVTAKMIFDVFHSNGFMLDVDLPLDNASGGHVGFGYLRFLSVSDANLAMQKMQGVHIDGHAINLEFSDTERLSPVQLHSWHGTVDYARLDGLRGTRCQSGGDHGMGEHPADERIAEQHLENASKRFPPVSQLEAQHVAEQWRVPPGPLPNPWPSEADSANDISQGIFPAGQTLSASSADAPSSQTERPPLHNIAQNSTAMDTWARLDRRERGRRWQAPCRNASEGSAENVSHPTLAGSPETNTEQAQDAEIEDCISSLVNMGFGSPEQGGRARLGVYAAAAKGNVYDAVGMIEDEQKIYADMRLD